MDADSPGDGAAVLPSRALTPSVGFLSAFSLQACQEHTDLYCWFILDCMIWFQSLELSEDEVDCVFQTKLELGSEAGNLGLSGLDPPSGLLRLWACPHFHLFL